MKGYIFLFPTIATSMAAIRQGSNSLCSLQLRDNVSTTSIERTNDWTIVSWTADTLWPTAHFYLGSDGRLYGGNGQGCSFSRMYTTRVRVQNTLLTTIANLICGVKNATAATKGFGITNDKLISLNGQQNFWYCADSDGDGHHAKAAPLILPPTGFFAQIDEPDYANCTSMTLGADNCFSRSDFVLKPDKINLSTGMNSQQEVTSKSGRTLCTLKHLLMGAFMALIFT